MQTERPLHEQQPTTRFTSYAGDYAKWRPSYPSEAVDLVVRGLPAGAIAIDAGAGTGIFARELVTRGLIVIAVEPNKAMRQHGAESGANAAHGAITWVNAAAENTGLPDHSADLVTCA